METPKLSSDLSSTPVDIVNIVRLYKTNIDDHYVSKEKYQKLLQEKNKTEETLKMTLKTIISELNLERLRALGFI